MVVSITDEEWDKLSPENFETHSLLRAVDAWTNCATISTMGNTPPRRSFAPTC